MIYDCEVRLFINPNGGFRKVFLQVWLAMMLLPDICLMFFQLFEPQPIYEELVSP